MRLLRHVLVACTVFLWEHVQSTTTVGKHTNSSALNLLTLPPRLDIIASFAPSVLGPQVVASDETELKDQDSEERVRPPLQSLSRVTDSVENLILASHFNVLKASFDRFCINPELRSNIDKSKFFDWLRKVEFIRAKRALLSDGDFMDLLVSWVNKKALAHTFHLIRADDKYKTWADGYQRLLAAKYPETIPSMIEMWAESGTHPGDVYGMLQTGMTVKYILSENAWIRIDRGLMDWAAFIDKYRGYGNIFSDYDVVTLLIKARGLQEVNEAIKFLLRYPKTTGIAKRLKKALDIHEKFMLQAQSGTNPAQVYEMMGITQEPVLEHSHDMQKRGPPVGLQLMLWLQYTLLFRAHGREFPDKAIVQLLVNKRGLREAMAFFHWLRLVPDMKANAASFQNLLAMTNVETCRAMLKLFQQTSTRPDEVLTFLSGVSAGWRWGWDEIALMLMKWLQYTQAYRAVPGNVFGNEAVVKVLIENMGADHTLLFIKTLYGEEDTKSLGATLKLIYLFSQK